MKHSIKFVLTVLSLPLTAQAYCDRYPDSTLTLNLPATITVPDSLPDGSLITSQAFSGPSPAFVANCPVAVRRWYVGRYPDQRYPGSNIYRTEVPGIGVRISLTWADGVNEAFFAIHTQPPQQVYGKIPSYTSATAHFYKMGPVTDGTIPAGNLWEHRWIHTPEVYRLDLGNAVRFVRPAATCDLAAGDVNRTITLPTIQASALKDVVYTGVHDFELTAQCSDATNVTFRFSGTPAPGNPLLFDNTGTAGGVDLWLYSRLNGVPQTISANEERTVAVSGDRAVLPLSAAYHKNGTVSQGSLASTATVNITYN
ncbi:fimbrial protein [Pseudomonas sp. FH1]|uniref:fimbrial protein n=1 Tax=Pseudomonas sp. FH1 TaxID=1284392 RepID=UPI0003DDA20C|nr:fimbrial protein [Pseudomonas sp. FH1]ETK23675.1 fimbrial protein [Pseudomonas sp. FH1]